MVTVVLLIFEFLKPLWTRCKQPCVEEQIWVIHMVPHSIWKGLFYLCYMQEALYWNGVARINLTPKLGFMLLLFLTTCTHLNKSAAYYNLQADFSLTPACLCRSSLLLKASIHTAHATCQSIYEEVNHNNPQLTRETFSRGCVSTHWNGVQCCMRAHALRVACGWVCFPLSVIECRVALGWQLAELILTREGRSPALGVTQTCQAWRSCIQPGRLVSLVPCHSGA